VPRFRDDSGETDSAVMDATRATARLPGVDIEIVHWPAGEGEAERISINLRAAPSFDAFGRALNAANPFAFWAHATQLAWAPWFAAARSLALPWTFALPRPSSDGASRSLRERGAPD
jgi:hypothetical protein